MSCVYSLRVFSNNIFGTKSHCVDIHYKLYCVCNPQGHGIHGHGETVHIPFPFDEEDLKGGKIQYLDNIY